MAYSRKPRIVITAVVVKSFRLQCTIVLLYCWNDEFFENILFYKFNIKYKKKLKKKYNLFEVSIIIYRHGLRILVVNVIIYLMTSVIKNN